jgi:hypothetical protein
MSLHKLARKASTYVMLKTEAEKLARDWRSSIENNQAEPVQARPRITFQDAATRYKKSYAFRPNRRPQAAAEMAAQIDRLVRVFGSRPLGSISSADIERWRDGRRADPALAHHSRAGDCQTNRLLARLRHLFVWSVQRSLVDATPVHAARRTRGGTQRRR